MFSFIKALFPSLAPVSEEERMAASALVETILAKAGTVAVSDLSHANLLDMILNDGFVVMMIGLQ